MPQLTVHNAEIKTATVEIKSLTVSGKQVTLAVFRQLVEAPLVNEDGGFAGLPWGTVNYHPGGCDHDDFHRHVVWQSGTELRRSKCSKPTIYSVTSDAIDDLLYAGGTVEEYGRWKPPSWATLRYPRDNAYQFKINQRATLQCLGYLPHSANHETDHPLVAAEFETLRQAVLLEVEIAEGRLNEARARWQEILDLPQLFIAV